MLDLPPPYSLITLHAAGDAFAHAQAIAIAEGAGTLVWAPNPADVDVAIVLEPVEILAISRQVVFAGLNAAADALAVDCPPERPIAGQWPDALLFNGGIVGGVQLAWPEGAEDAVPDYLVLGLRLRGGVLAEEGFLGFEPDTYIENFARYLMLALDDWQALGPQAVVARFRQRCGAES